MPRQYNALWVCVLPWAMELENPAAANDLVAVVEDGGLAGSDGALGFIKVAVTSPGPAGWSVAQAGSCRWRILIFTRMGAVRVWNADPIQSPGTQSARGQFRIGADRDAMACRINLQDVERRR